ncbi:MULTISPECIES: hypothetical protein [unclassified Xanthomonas]|uniref:hypothetical protein n=1 Tax=unclassified Xanthomonas TaxID=2643310 RepID=UPI002889D8D6|nr:MULTISPECIES: hypothetical protein [unclassified Xanthomonas]
MTCAFGVARCAHVSVDQERGASSHAPQRDGVGDGTPIAAPARSGLTHATHDAPPAGVAVLRSRDGTECRALLGAVSTFDQQQPTANSNSQQQQPTATANSKGKQQRQTAKANSKGKQQRQTAKANSKGKQQRQTPHTPINPPRCAIYQPHTQRRHPKVASLFCFHCASRNAEHVLADYLAAPPSGTNLIS